jgi:hypothetical protein
MRELPADYEKMCYESKAIERRRGVDSAGDLMLLVMYHLLNGCSLLEISEIAKLTKLGNMSDVAFMKRFEKCCEWFVQINAALMSAGMAAYQVPWWMEKYTVVAVDASDVTEKGRSGRLYRLHFALDIFNLKSLQYKITTQAVGEKLENFEIKSGYLMLADRIYSTAKGIKHCRKSGGNFIMRLRKNNFRYWDEAGERVDLLERLREIDTRELDISVKISDGEGSYIPVRVCAIRKKPEDILKAHKRLDRKRSKKQESITPETIEFNEYIVLVTSLTEPSAAEILEAYRYRWQVEIYFKRLKSIIGYGELPKRRENSVLAWLNGKLMIALLLEKFISSSSFSPSTETGFSSEYLA